MGLNYFRVLIIALLIMFFTGLADFDNSINKFLVQGNRLYANYEQALSAYNEGLKKDSENLKLNYNSGQASYLWRIIKTLSRIMTRLAIHRTDTLIREFQLEAGG